MKKGFKAILFMITILLCSSAAFSENKLKSSGNVSSGSFFYEYTAGKKRDPFMPLIVKEDSKINIGRISGLRLIGILWDETRNYALVTFADGKSYILKEGMRLGFDGEVVHKITKDSIIFRKYIKGRKGLVPKDTILKLRPEEKNEK